MRAVVDTNLLFRMAASPCFLVTSDRDLYDDADLVARLNASAVEVIQAGEFIARLRS